MSLCLAWELTGEETLEGFVDFLAIVINISVGPRGFWYDWAPGVVQTVQTAHAPESKCFRWMTQSTDEAREHLHFWLLRCVLSIWLLQLQKALQDIDLRPSMPRGTDNLSPPAFQL